MVATPNGNYVFAIITQENCERKRNFYQRSLRHICPRPTSEEMIATPGTRPRIIYIVGNVITPEDNKPPRRQRVCPVEHAGILDGVWRRLLQNPRKILSPYIRDGMTVLDFGCGPGFFTVTMAELVGPTGRVLAVDLQEGMLRLLGSRIRGSKLESRVTLHRCSPDCIGVNAKVDFILAFYVVHELPDQHQWCREVADLLRPKGLLLIVEPRPFHVSKADFEQTILAARTAGLAATSSPRVLLSRTALLNKKVV